MRFPTLTRVGKPAGFCGRLSKLEASVVPFFQEPY